MHFNCIKYELYLKYNSSVLLTHLILFIVKIPVSLVHLDARALALCYICDLSERKPTAVVKYTIMSDSVAFLLMDQFAPNVNPHGCNLQAVGKLLNSLLIRPAKTVSILLIHTA